jgi:hypothetical protein
VASEPLVEGLGMSIVQDNVNAELDRIDRIHNRCIVAFCVAVMVIVVVGVVAWRN